MNTRLALELAAAMGAVGLLGYHSGRAAEASTPAAVTWPPEVACAFDVITVTNASQAISGTLVTVNNGARAGLAVVRFSADTGVDPDAEVRIAYSIDGAPPLEDHFGPVNLANHQQFWEARAVIAAILLGPGTHTIQPYWRVSGAPGKRAFMDSRCMEVETRPAGASAGRPQIR